MIKKFNSKFNLRRNSNPERRKGGRWLQDNGFYHINWCVIQGFPT